MSLSGPAHAHSGSTAFLEGEVDGARLRLTVDIFDPDLDEPLGIDRNRDQQLDAAELSAGRKKIGAYLGERITLELGGARCPAEAVAARPSPRQGRRHARTELVYRCPRQIDRGLLRYRLFFDLDARHTGLLRIDAGRGTVTHIFSSHAPTFELQREVPLWQQLREYAVFGVVHIFTGYDHILFLLGLLLAAAGPGGSLAARLRAILLVVTAFTVAHSLTLVGAALGLVRLPTRLVESVIAASVVYVGVENLLLREPRRRWLLTFGFGLIHGFGFAGVLAELGLPARGVVTSLLAFNLGVEAGQVAIVVVLLPVLVWLAPYAARRWPALARRLGGEERFLTVVGSVPIALFGLLWLLERAGGLRIFG